MISVLLLAGSALAYRATRSAAALGPEAGQVVRPSGGTGVAPAASPQAEPEAPPVQAAPSSPPPAIEGVRVVVYTTSWCPVCKRAKTWMAARGISYEDHDIEASSDDARAIRQLNPRGSIPTFDIEGDVMVGFSESDLLAALERAAHRHTAPAL